MACRGAELKTHTYNADDPTGTVGTVHQADSTSDVIEYNMQAGRTVLVQDVRTSFVPSRQRFKMEGQRHHIVSDQQIQLREQRRQEQRNGVQRQVLRDLHDRTHNHDGSLKTWHPTLVELLDRFPAESQDELILKDCNIGQMPKHMEILRHIRTVDLSSNKIRELSEGISEILGLQVLNLSNNQLVALPKTTKLLTNLRVLSEADPKVRANLCPKNARANHLTKLPDMLGMKYLRDLNVADNDLEVLHYSIQTLSSLTVLDVRYCQLRELPDEVCDLQENLCTIHFDYNFVTSFPKPIGRLRGLRNLNLSKNEIKTVPVGCIEYMSGLQRLDLSQNQLRDIPQTIGINQGLRELILNNNEIDVAPRSLVALTGLVKLNLACNNLKRVPEITTLSCLRELRLDDNELERLPVRLYYLTQLQVLEARDNPNLTVPPASISLQGRNSIMQWLAEEDVRERKAGLFDARLRGVVQRFIEQFPNDKALRKSFQIADTDGSGSMTLIELDEWIKSMGINDLSFADVQFLGGAIDSDNSGFVEVEELIVLYERFKAEKIIREEEAEEMDEEYLKRARAALIDEEMNEAANRAIAEAAEARRKFEERRKAKEAAKAAAAAQ